MRLGTLDEILGSLRDGVGATTPPGGELRVRGRGFNECTGGTRQ